MSRNDKELEDLAGYKPGVVIGEGRWKIMELLDEGGFGKVYRVQDLKAPTQYAALKIESTNMEGGSAIKLEKTALERIHRGGRKAHVPDLYRSSRRKNICYMIVTLLGDNLRKIKDRYYPKGYPLKVWVKVAIQCLYAIKTVHDSGFVHRDIKAPNFVFGHPGDPKKARVVHIIDFGLARQYVLEDKKKAGTFRPRPARPHTDFRGTWQYASPAMHDYVELGRKDDIWSLLFMLMDLYATLPWANLDTLEQIGHMKQNMKDADLMLNMPPELRDLPPHLRSLDVYGKPGYAGIYDMLERIFKRSKASWADPYDWENRDMAARNLAVMNAEKDDNYRDPRPFFLLDAIGISVGPSKFSSEDLLSRNSNMRNSSTITSATIEQSPSAERMTQATVSPISVSKPRKPKK